MIAAGSAPLDKDRPQPPDHTPPATLPVRSEGIPAELATRSQWVAWRWEYRPDQRKRWTKVPINPHTGQKASTTDPRTWGTLAEAMARAAADGLAGVGFVFSPDDPYIGVDLDGCRDPITGELHPWAVEIVDELDSYAELSPTETGIHIIARGVLPDSVKTGAVEAYDRGRYFTFTGHPLAGAPATITEQTVPLAALHARLTEGRRPIAARERAPSNGHRPGVGLSDQELIVRALNAKNGGKVGQLYRGDASGYPSNSEADLALCSALAFWSQDAAQLDRVFRGSGLFRPDKWDTRHHGDGRTYGEGTITRAIDGRGEFWTPAGTWVGPPRPNPNGDADTGLDQRAPLPSINAGDQHLPRVSEAAWAALTAANDPPRLFRFGGLPARLDRDDDHSPPVPRTLTEDRLRHELARAADWHKSTEKGGTTPAAPPVAVVRDMLAASRFPFPPLTAIIEAPAFAPDGSLPGGPGYHAAGQSYYAPAAGLVVPTIPNDPTPAEIAAARELIVGDFLGDFPFTGDAERAHAVALLLLLFVRGLVTGPTPLHLIEKPTPGTGASLLADVLTRLATGRPVGAMAEGRDEDEWRKRITAKLRGAPAVVLLDNLRRRLDSATLSIALTAAEWTDRLLGTSDDLRLPVRCAWVATGNNPALSSEIARRTVRIRLDAQRDRPWLREGFRHPNLGRWTLEHRGELIGACLTLGQAWIAAGGPVSGDAPKLGSYEEWSRVLGGILDTAGVPGFLGNLAEFYEQTDTEGSAIRGFLRAWWEQHHGAPVGVGDLFTVASAPESGLDLGDKGERSQRIRLGNRLKELRDRHYQLTDDLTVRITEAGIQQRAQLWRLVPTETETQTAAAWGAGESSESSECSESTSNPRAYEGDVTRNGYGRETFTTFTTFTGSAPVSDEATSEATPAVPLTLAGVDVPAAGECRGCGALTDGGRPYCRSCM